MAKSYNLLRATPKGFQSLGQSIYHLFPGVNISDVFLRHPAKLNYMAVCLFADRATLPRLMTHQP
jgi:hypothetical protein